MDLEIVKHRLDEEHATVHDLLLSSAVHGLDDRDAANEPGDWSDAEEGLTSQEQDDAVTAGLRLRLGQLHRALDRLEAGSYGLSVRSGQVISDERLDADPAAELTVDEASDNSR